MARFAALLLASLALGCGRGEVAKRPPPGPDPDLQPGPPVYEAYAGPVGQFKDDAAANAAVAADAFPRTYVDAAGQPLDLARYRGVKPVVVVVMRGFPGFVCPNCSAQTSRLIRNYPEFARRGAELLVVYPGPKDSLAAFVAQSRREADNAAVPFPLLLDPDFAAVNKLGIRADLARPSTYVLDKAGEVRFAYVGASTADRPSVKAMLDQLDRLTREGP